MTQHFTDLALLYGLLVGEMSPRIGANLDERGLFNLHYSCKLDYLSSHSSYIDLLYISTCSLNLALIISYIRCK